MKVVEENEHLGHIVSGINQEEKNIDERLIKEETQFLNSWGQPFPKSASVAPY